MAKKSKLSLVKPSPPIGNDPPSSLGQAGRKLWRTLTSEFVIDDAAGLEMLTQICAAIDRLVALQETIEADGLMVRTKAGPKEHPLLKIELQRRPSSCAALAGLASMSNR